MKRCHCHLPFSLTTCAVSTLQVNASVSHDSCRREYPQSHCRGAEKLCKAAHRKKRSVSVLTAAMPSWISPTHVCGTSLVPLVSVCCSRTFKNSVSIFSKDEMRRMILRTESFMRVHCCVVAEFETHSCTFYCITCLIILVMHSSFREKPLFLPSIVDALERTRRSSHLKC